MSWTDPLSGETSEGFKEIGFIPEAFINLLALLGWNDGTEKEIFSIEELIQAFTIEKVHKGGAHFDYEKAKWFNHEWIKKSSVDSLRPAVKKMLIGKNITDMDDSIVNKVIGLVKDRCTLLTDFYDHAWFFFKPPEQIDTNAILPKWNDQKKQFFSELIRNYKLTNFWTAGDLEKTLKEMAAAHQLKPGELMLPFRIMLVGGKFGPGVFEIAEILGKDVTVGRIERTLSLLS
jgi:glutamyl-tRNA synthetase